MPKESIGILSTPSQTGQINGFSRASFYGQQASRILFVGSVLSTYANDSPALVTLPQPGPPPSTPRAGPPSCPIKPHLQLKVP